MSRPIDLAVIILLMARTSQFSLKQQCRRDLIQSYGLEGRSEPSATAIEMCPGITDSCCTKEDQFNMYSNWVHSQEK